MERERERKETIPFLAVFLVPLNSWTIYCSVGRSIHFILGAVPPLSACVSKWFPQAPSLSLSHMVQEHTIKCAKTIVLFLRRSCGSPLLKHKDVLKLWATERLVLCRVCFLFRFCFLFFKSYSKAAFETSLPVVRYVGAQLSISILPLCM